MIEAARSGKNRRTTSRDCLAHIVFVAGFGQGPAVMEVNPKVPATTVPEFIAYAKANPGKINMGSAGIGTPKHVV
jgi:tripartite-type tricarboxylate transporter receptor subunit TctC